MPWMYGAAVGSYGIVMPVIPGETACLRCIYPDPPAGAQPTCETAGVLGPVTALIASLQVAGAIQILCGAAAGAEDHDCGCLERRDPSGGAAGAGERLPSLRASRVPVSQRRAPCAGEPLRPKRGADSRTGAAAGVARSGGSACTAGFGSFQRIRAALRNAALFDDHLSRRPRHHQRNHRRGHRSQFVCALYWWLRALCGFSPFWSVAFCWLSRRSHVVADMEAVVAGTRAGVEATRRLFGWRISGWRLAVFRAGALQTVAEADIRGGADLAADSVGTCRFSRTLPRRVPRLLRLWLALLQYGLLRRLLRSVLG